MAIYAKQTNINDIIIIKPLNDGDILSYDQKIGRFINKKVQEFSNSINEIENLAGTNSIGVYSKKEGNTAFFRSLEAGANVTLEQFDDKIIITSDNIPSTLSVTGNFSIIIDSLNNEPNSVFEILTASSSEKNPIVINAKSIFPVTSSQIFTGVENNISFIESRNEIDWISKGFKEGMFISIKGTTDQDGEFTIKSIKNFTKDNIFISRIYLIEEWNDSQKFNLGGPKFPTTITQGDLYVSTVPDEEEFNQYPKNKNFILISYSLDFGPSGFDLRKGMVFNLKNAGDRSGVYTIENVYPRGSTFFDYSYILTSLTTPISGNEGIIFESNPYESTILIEINDFLIETGFTVNKKGEITSPTIKNLEDRISALEKKINSNNY